MHKTLVVLIAVVFGFVCVQGFAIESRSNGVNEEVYSKYVCNGKQNGARIMVVGTCTKYYECKSNGESIIKTCKSPKKFFDSSSGNCVATSSCIEPKGDCSTPKPKPTPPCNNNKKTTTVKPTASTTNEQKLQQTELEKQFANFFGASGQKCDSPGGSCRGLLNGSLIPYKNNCKMFLTCFNGCGAEMICPTSLHFNQKTRLCDKPENSICNL